MNFKQSLDYLFGLGYERSVKKFGLENSIILLKALGNPQNNFIKIQIAGTNGKGSTCAFLESICVKAGVKVGANTSPHLISVTERIRVDGVEISEKRFAEYVLIVREVCENLAATGELEAIPTFFEHITAVAQLVFADEGVEVAILETGLGGRFDATTATNAEIVAITPIDLDHIKTLGDTIEKIAAEKAAVIREGSQVVISKQKEEVLRIILAKCEETGGNPVIAENVAIDLVGEKATEVGNGSVTAGEELGKAKTSFQTDKSSYNNVCLNLPGKHQIDNAVVAILLAEALQDRGFTIASENIKAGLENAVHKGRLEFSDGMLFDGAHNVSGAEALKNYLIQFIDQPITMIFGTMGGKNLNVISQILFPLAENLIFTTPENPRVMEAEKIAGFVPGEFRSECVHVIDEVAKAIEKAREIVGDGLILVTGSLYLIGEVQAVLRDRKVERRKVKT